MAQTIKLKRSSVQNNTPSTSDLELGELAINTYDGKLFIKKDDGSASIVQVGGIVGTSELTDGSVTTTKIANNAVTAAKLANNSVGIAQLNVSDGTSGQVLTTNGSGTLSFTTVSSGSSNQNAFSNVAVPGQTTIAADGTTDTLNLAAGSGIQLTTNAGTDTLTITSTATGSVTEAFKTIAVSGQNNVVADSATDTLTFVAGSNMTITTNASNDTITFASSGSGASGNTGGIDSQIFNGDGTDTTFTLTNAPTSEDHLWVFVDGVYQNKDSYSISGTTLTMADAPDNGTKLAVHHVRVGTPGTGAITAAMLASPLSLSGDFAVDTNVLKVDASNNRVGINVTTPSHPLDVVGTINVTSGNIQTTGDMIIGAELMHNGDTDTKLQFGTNDIKLIAGGATHFHASSDQKTQLMSGNATTMVLDTSQRVGIGTSSPTVSLDVGSKTDAIKIPVGTTAQRPSNVVGSFRYNSTDSQFEGYTASGWGAIAGSGSGSSSNFLAQELTGDGTTTAFTLNKTVTSEDNLLVFNEGVFQRKDSYAATGTTITFDTAPASSNKIVVYQMETGVVGVAPKIDTMTGDGSDTTLTLSVAPASENQTIVNIDGVTQHKATYSVSGTTLTFSSPPPNGSAVECITLTNMSVTTIGDDDLDTKIHFDETADDDVIRFDTAGTERMVIGGTGKVGIGTNNPQDKLHILDGDLGIQNSSGRRYRLIAETNGGFTLRDQTAAAGRFTIDTSGNATFNQNLTVAGDLNITGDINSASVTDLDVTDKTITLGKGQSEGLSGGSGIVIDGSNASILWDETNSTWDFNNAIDVQLIRADTLNNRANSANIIYRTSTNTIVGNNASALVVQDGGNIGIGTTSPSSKLEIFNSSVSGNTQLHVHNDKSGDAAVLKLEGKRSSLNDTGQVLFANNSNLVAKIDARSAGDDGELRFFTSPSSSGSTLTQRMVIESGGDVGIGITNPLAKLHVDGDVYVDTGHTLFSDIIRPYATTRIQFGQGTNDISHFTGKVGIGIQSPGYPLEVASTATTSIAYQRTGVSAKKWGFDSDNAATYLINLTDNVRAITAYNNGNIGIGTITPGVELDIKKVSNNYPLRIGSEQGSGRAMVFADVHSSPTKYNWLVGAQYTVNNGFEITASTAVGGYTFSNPGIVVLETGNVGIGTTSPTYKLDVAGDIGVNEYIYHNDDTNTYMRFQSDSWLVRAGGDDRLFVDGTNGRVGIGTNSPSNELHVYSGSSSDIARFSNANGAFVLGKTANLGSLDMASDADFRIRHGSTLSARFKANGSVFIGDAPAGTAGKTLSARINQSSGIHFPLVIGGGTHSAGAAFGLGFDPEGYGNRNKMAILAEGIGTGYSRGRLHFALDANNNSDQAALADSKMCITESGKIGIGNQLDNPHGRLHVKGASTNEAEVHETGSMKSYRNVATNFTTSSANRYWHIKTSIATNTNVMFVAHVEGYAYGSSGHIIDIKRSGYMYSPSAAVINTQTVNNGSDTSNNSLNTYNSSDGYLVFVTDFNGGYYSGGTFHIMFPAPAGYNNNFSVQAQVMNSTSTGHY